jgi:hypothetical protein
LTGRRRPADFLICRHCRKPFRAISASHLRRRHGYDYWTSETTLDEIRRWPAERHSTRAGAVDREYPALLHKTKKFFGSWDAARDAAGVCIDRGRPTPQIVPPREPDPQPNS